ncbi:MAG: DUF3300 domain-containing protein [Planctomycetota bacterium]|nr:DUF3300 domain-containing protein [Planctomycetota bacterium]
MQSTTPVGARWIRSATVLLASLLALSSAHAQQSTSSKTAKPLTPEQLQQLVAPIALYPDSLLSQVLMASTYPLEIVEAERWAKAHPGLDSKALENAMQDQTWDPSVKSLTAFPQVLEMMSDKLTWTTQLGDAFLADQKSVMNSIQGLREKAKNEGHLKSNEQQTVKVEDQPTGDQNQTIVITPTNPNVVYVPVYNPTVIYGPWAYPAYPPFYWYPPGYVATSSMMSFGMGMAVGAALWGGCDWHHSNVDINVNRYNSFNRTNITNVNWHHNTNHRRGVPYGNRSLQNRFGADQARDAKARDAFRGRADLGRQQLGSSQFGNFSSNRSGDAFQNAGDRFGNSTRAANFGDGNMGSNFGNGNVNRSSLNNARSSFDRSPPAFGGMDGGRDAFRDSARGFESRGGFSRGSGMRGSGGFGGMRSGGFGGMRGGGRRR